MFVAITGEVKNSFGRLIPIGDVIETSEQRGRELIRLDLAVLVDHNVRLAYQNEVQRIRNREELPPPQPEKKRTWFGRLFGA